jgi:hypothetical protein
VHILLKELKDCITSGFNLREAEPKEKLDINDS